MSFFSPYRKFTTSRVRKVDATATLTWPVRHEYEYTTVVTTDTGYKLSEGHPLPPWSSRNNGGPFYLDRTIFDPDIRSFDRVGNATAYRVRGDLFPAPKADPLTRYPLSGDTKLRGFGTTAIARTEPTDAYFSASTAIGELRKDGLPAIVGLGTMRDKTRQLRNAGKHAGDEYLNVQFGWLPLVADVRKLIRAVQKSDEIMSAYRRQSDARIRRRYSAPIAEESASATVTGWPLQPIGYTITPLGRGTQVAHRFSRYSFSGAFRYYLPETDDGFDPIRQKLRKVYGLEMTPELLWNLSPWSWAADWFGNVGDVMHNISAFGRDGLVMDYGYAMEESTLRVSSYWDYGSWGTFSQEKESSFKSRVSASPYGFSVGWPDFTPRQLAIVGALGLSRT